MSILRNVFLCALVLLVMMVIVGCPRDEDEQLNRVAYIINGELGDLSFYDSGQAGIDQISEMWGVEVITVETNFDPTKQEQGLESIIQWGADVVFAISFGYEDLLKRYAADNPETIFVNIDTVVQNDAGNITNIDFIEEEGAFMAGAAAALLTTDQSIPRVNASKVIGSVGGDEDPVISAFLYGYENGAQYIDSEITVENIYAGVWDDPVRGKQAAEQLYSRGADVVFQIAGLTGLGVLEAARDSNLYAIGVDSNQNSLYPGYVVTSDLKEVGRSIIDVYRTIQDGTLVRGSTQEYGLAEDAVGLAIDEYTRAILPAESIDRLSEIKQQIIDGQIVVPRL